MIKLIHIIFTILLVFTIKYLLADDPYCEKFFDGKIIITNKIGGSVHKNPSQESEILLTLDYGKVVDGCLWDTYPDTINQIPGHWRKVGYHDIIGYIFSSECHYYDPITYSEEKIIKLEGNNLLNYCLTNNFYGIFKTSNGDSLLKCIIDIKRYTIDEIESFNKGGPYYPKDSHWHYVTTDRPYDCLLLFSTKQTFPLQEIKISSFNTSLNNEQDIFEIDIQKCETAQFKTNQQNSLTKNGFKKIDFYHLLIQNGESKIIDTVYSCNNCYEFSNFKFDFLGDINGDKIVDFLLHKTLSITTYRDLFISNGLNSRYRISNER